VGCSVPLEGLLVESVARSGIRPGLWLCRRSGRTATPTASASASATASAATPVVLPGAAALVLGDLRGGPAQRRADLVRHHLHLGAPVALLGLPAALLEASGHHHP